MEDSTDCNLIACALIIQDCCAVFRDVTFYGLHLAPLHVATPRSGVSFRFEASASQHPRLPANAVEAGHDIQAVLAANRGRPVSRRRCHFGHALVAVEAIIVESEAPRRTEDILNRRGRRSR